MNEQAIAAAKAHRHRLVLSDRIHLRIQAHGPEALQAFNAAAARRIAAVLSSMWFFWFCALLDLAELPAVAASSSVVIWVGYVSQTVIQLLALPALGAYARLISEQQDEQARAQGETLAAIHALVADVHTINDQQTHMLDDLVRLHGGPGPSSVRWTSGSPPAGLDAMG